MKKLLFVFLCVITFANANKIAQIHSIKADFLQEIKAEESLIKYSGKIIVNKDCKE